MESENLRAEIKIFIEWLKNRRPHILGRTPTTDLKTIIMIQDIIKAYNEGVISFKEASKFLTQEGLSETEILCLIGPHEEVLNLV